MLVRVVLAFVVALLISLLFVPFIIKASKKFKMSQTILHYVEAHKQKQGTPTMGGFIFIIGIVVSAFAFMTKDLKLGAVCLASMICFGVLGFLDDYIKIKYKQNEGLKPYQKIIGQLALSIILGVFVYTSKLVSTEVFIPFFNKTIDFGFWIIPFVIFIVIALTNSVNLTDGLDGLATSVSICYLVFFGVIAYMVFSAFPETNAIVQAEKQNLVILSSASVGGLLGFLCVNTYPAKIFMGDTGSLAIGGLLSALAVTSGLSLFIPFLGVMFVVSTISDIIQVLHYKRTKRRVFLMAPLHHHFEKKNIHENRIVLIYLVITVVFGALLLLTI